MGDIFDLNISYACMDFSKKINFKMQNNNH